MDAEIQVAAPVDAGEILTLQRAAYVTEAQLYGDPFIPPLVESTGQLRKAVENGIVLKAVDAGRIVGSVRGTVKDRVCLVARLVVAPDRQGEGIGTALLRAIEEEAGTEVFDLFTGHLSEGNLRLYRRAGYAEIRRERVHEHLYLVHLRKTC